jgi:hypothetical protein
VIPSVVTSTRRRSIPRISGGLRLLPIDLGSTGARVYINRYSVRNPPRLRIRSKYCLISFGHTILQVLFQDKFGRFPLHLAYLCVVELRLLQARTPHLPCVGPGPASNLTLDDILSQPSDGNVTSTHIEARHCFGTKVRQVVEVSAHQVWRFLHLIITSSSQPVIFR